jgi:hypothetical protein
MRPLAGIVLLLAALAGCASDPEARPLRVTHAPGFAIQDDGSLSAKELEKLSSELVASKEKLLAVLKQHAFIADFRAPEDRQRASCPQGAPHEIRVTVLSGEGGRCHADETGITLLRSHIDRKDGTHELVHYLAGGSWRPVDEGLAVWLTEKLHGPAAGVPLDVRARAYMDLSLEQGLDRDRLRPGMSRSDYDIAGSFVKWLIDERGFDAFMALYHGQPGDYHGVYGVSEQELFAKWREKIRAMNVRQDGAYYRFKDFLSRP